MDSRLIENEADSFFWTNCRLQLSIPSVLARGEVFALRIAVLGPDSLPVQNFSRPIVFEQSRGIEGLPDSLRFEAGDGGQATVPELKAIGPDCAYILARPEGGPAPVASNPAWVMVDPPYRIFWGDLHAHTTYSDCSPWACKDPEFCYAYARDISNLDFAAACDHVRGIASDVRRWPRLRELVELYDSPGRFVPILAFESSHKSGFGGDNNAYYSGSGGPYFWLDRQDMLGTQPEVPLQQLWNFMDATGEEYLTIPHHTARAGKFRSFADPVYNLEREPLFEIFSGWGSSETRWNRFPLSGGNSEQPAYYVDTIKAGCRYGVIASSDDHCTLPGGEHVASQAAGGKRLSGYVHKGLAAVRCSSLTREELWKAFRRRDCYATTLTRTLLDVRIGDASMGQAIAVSPSDPLRQKRRIGVNVLTTEPSFTEVVLLRNGKEIDRRRWQMEERQVVFEDDQRLDSVAIRDAPFHEEPFVAYYVRVENRFAHTQWSSPIWLDL